MCFPLCPPLNVLIFIALAFLCLQMSGVSNPSYSKCRYELITRKCSDERCVGLGHTKEDCETGIFSSQWQWDSIVRIKIGDARQQVGEGRHGDYTRSNSSATSNVFSNSLRPQLSRGP